jgi:Right handed beta helix region
MKKSLLFFISFGASLFLCATTRANTFYVSTSGNDANPGSQVQPWRTLQYAVDRISPGDTILVESGTYVGCRIGHSGQPGAPCTLKADSGASVLVNAPGPVNRHSSNIEIELFDDTVRYWVIDGFESANSPRYGIDVRVTDFITVQNCYSHNSALTGIFLAFSDHPLIQNNESAFNGEHGIYDSNSGDFPTIRGNRSHHNHSAGIHMNGDRTQTPGDGVISFAVVEKNVIYENGVGGGSGINCDGVSDSIFRNNLLYSNHASGISLYATDGAEGSSRNKVYNNTIVMAAGARWCVNIPAATEGQPDPTGNQVRNNILYTPDTGLRGSILTYSAAVTGFTSDYNIVVDRFSIDSGSSTLSLAAWRSLGYDLHSVIATPSALFVDPTGNNYHLKLGSPAIAAGTALAEVTDDLDGSPRPSGNPYAIGCVEGPRYQGFNDGAGCDTIQGWAWDANNPNSTVNVDIYDGTAFIATTPANMYREDLANALGSPNHGFSFNTPASLRNGAAHTIYVKFSGTSTLLNNTGRTVQCSQAANLYGRHDGQGCNTIEGWAWDSNDRNGTVNVDIYDGATLIATVAATLYRQDLADALGSPYHGWIFHTPASLRDGQPHTITAKFGGTNTNLPLDTPRTTSCSSGTPNFQGNLDVADCNFISGYAWDANDDQGTIVVAIYVDGNFLVVVPAQEAYAGVGTGYHGFKFAVPSSLKDGQQHSIQTRFSGTSTSLSSSPKVIVCTG